MKALKILNLAFDESNFQSLRGEINEAIAELEALQNRNCSNCKYCMYVYSYIYPLCTENESEPFQIHSSEKLKCDKWSSK